MLVIPDFGEFTASEARLEDSVTVGESRDVIITFTSPGSTLDIRVETGGQEITLSDVILTGGDASILASSVPNT